MTPNDKLPEEIINQIDKEVAERTNGEDERIQKRSTDYGRRISHLNGYEIGYIEGATAWAPWKVRFEELQAKAQRMADALELTRACLSSLIKPALWNQEVSNEQRELIKTRNTIDAVLQQFKDGKGKEWQPMATAPKDGSTIEVTYDAEGKETCLACWSQNPVCMLGPRNGSFPPGWATPIEAECDTNLPLDPPLMWRPYLTNPK